MKKMLLLLVILGFPALASDDEGKIELARSIFFGSDIMNLEEHTSAMTQMILTRKPYWKTHEALISNRVANLYSSSTYQNKIAKVISSNFTNDELLQLADIMKTPAMVKWNNRLPDFWPQITMETTNHIIPIIEELTTEILKIESRKSTNNQKPSKFELLVQNGNCQDAKLLSDKLLKENSKDIEALYFKGYCLMQEQSNYEAKNSFQKVFELNKNYRRVNYNLALMYLYDNNFSAAIEHALLDIERYPTDSDSYSLLAKAYGYNGNQNESLRYFDKSLKLNPRNVGTLYDLAILYLRNGNKQESCKIFKSAEIYEPTISKLPTRIDACGL